MTYENPIDYHRRRAARELDLGFTARRLEAARAHLQLASLHMERLRALSGHTLPHRPALSM